MDSVTQSYQDARLSARIKLAKIGNLIDAHKAAQAERPDHWGYVGDMRYVAEKLEEIRQFLGGEE